MGGVGSGTWYRGGSKTTCEEVRRVDIRYMRQQGMLQPGSRGWLNWTCRGEADGSIQYRVEANALILIYRYRENGGEWQDVVERVWLDRTPCNYGGERLWLNCPHCGKRVAILYGQGKRFLCRHCYRLTYGSQSEGLIGRMQRKARKIRKRLGGSDDLFMLVWDKPKGMHWKTFKRLVKEDEQAVTISDKLIYQQMRFYGMVG